MLTKQIASVQVGVESIQDGDTVMIGGFGEAGSPIELIHALIDHGATDITVINNNTGSGEVGLAALIKEKRVAKMARAEKRMFLPNNALRSAARGPAITAG